MSTLTTSILDALAAKGVDATEFETTKNGIRCTGFQINVGKNAKPVVYYSSEETVEAFTDKVLEIIKHPAPEIDANDLVSREKLLKDTILCVQRQSNENLVKREYLNIELYVRVLVDIPIEGQSGSIKITPQILEMSGLTENELFDAAKRNAIEKAQICTMAETLGAPEELFSEIPFYVGTYDSRCHGAAILAIPEVLHEFCKSRDYFSVWILPSSTEEILLLPMDSADPSELSAMVNDVNTTNVDEILWLEPVCYKYDDETRKVSIAASYESGNYIVKSANAS